MPTVIIYWSPGRSDTQKAAVARQITTTLVEDAGANQNDVLIIFQNIQPGDSVRGSQTEIGEQLPDPVPDHNHRVHEE